MNSLVISGNLTRDAELRTTQSGMNVLKFSVAVSEYYKQQDETKERTSFIDCTMFGKRTEYFADRLTKGAKVVVLGKVRQERWDDDLGKKHSKISVIVDDIEAMTKQQEPTTTYDTDIPF